MKVIKSKDHGLHLELIKLKEAKAFAKNPEGILCFRNPSGF